MCWLLMNMAMRIPRLKMLVSKRMHVKPTMINMTMLPFKWRVVDEEAFEQVPDPHCIFAGSAASSLEVLNGFGLIFFIRHKIGHFCWGGLFLQHIVQAA